MKYLAKQFCLFINRERNIGVTTKCSGLKTRTMFLTLATGVVAFALTATLTGPAGAQIRLPFDAPWFGYNAGSSAFPGNSSPFERDPYAIASADFDGDGDVDVVVANYDFASPGGTSGHSGFAVLFNEGGGVFSDPAHYTFTTKGSFDVVVGDFNEDGHPDLALPNSGRINGEDGNTVVVFLNDGSGTFTLTGEYAVAERPMLLAVGDFDSDGHLDIAADSYRFDSRSFAVLFGTGTGGFAPRVLIPVVDVPYLGLEAFDMDGNGDDDIAVSVLGDLYVIRSNGDRTFSTPVLVSEAGSQPLIGVIAAGDVNGDGHLDLVHGVSATSSSPHAEKDVVVRLGYGNGTFALPAYYDAINYSTTPEAIELVDIDGDGDLDVVICDWSGRTGDGIAILFNNGTGVLGGAHHVPAGQGTADITVADVDGDGQPDVVSSDRMSMAIMVHLNPGNGRLPVLQSRFTTGTTSNIRLDAGDVDGDGDLDVFSSGESFGVPGALLRNNGDGTFAAPVIYTHSGDYGRGASRGKLRDLNGDGHLDLLYNTAHTDFQEGYNFYTAMNDGTGTFSPIVRVSNPNCGMGDVDAFDLDNDGDLDVVNLEELACQSIPESGRRIYVSLNNGNGTFKHLPPFMGTQGPHALAAGDLNEDGFLDLVTAHWPPYGFYRELNVHLGNGDGTFLDETVYIVGQGPNDLVVVDLDGDGHLDVAATSSGQDETGRETMAVLWGAGNGSLTPATLYYAPYSPDLMGTTGIEAGDVDGDGDLDLMVTTVANGVAMYYNDGARGFDFAHRLGIYWRPSDPFYADFDGDGIPDLATLVSAPPSGLPSELAILPGSGFISQPVTGRKAFDFDGDGKTDVSIFRPNGASGAEWWYLKSSDGGNGAFAFGANTDTPVPADFTGDGKTDVAFWRPSTGEWYVIRSEDSTFFAFPFGSTGDIPMPGDFDGDGEADATVFRPSANIWFTRRSSDGQVTTTPFGAAGDKPVAADFDGDGKTDIAIYRPNGSSGSGEWWFQRSSDGGNRAFAFGSATDKAVPADFTGDGKADLAFWRPSTGEWYVVRSEDDTFFAFPFGVATDIPVPGDYDGDGKADAAIFRPSENIWYLLRSTAGFQAVAFGAAGDTPLPNSYVR